MSVAFDWINRNKPIEDLRNTIKADELHIISKMPRVKFSKPTLEHHKETLQAHLSLSTTLLKP